MKKSIKLILTASLLFIGLAGIVFSYIQKKDDTQNETHTISIRDYLLNSFLNELPSINNKLPFQIDANTVLLSIEYIDSKIVSRYELKNFQTVSKFDAEYIKQLTYKLRQQECLDDVKKRLIDTDIEFLSKYQDSRGSEVFEVIFNKSICAEFPAMDYKNQPRK
jgi:hypothetical protein